MFGQTVQNATEPDGTSLEDRAFEQRTRGSYTFRFARQLWYGMSMAIMKNRRIDKPVSIEGADEAVKTVHASLSTDQNGLPSARNWVHKAQNDGYGVVVIPMDDGTETIVKTKRAEVAEQLTADDASFVLNEPSGDWDDVSLASLLVVPALALAGLVGIVFAVGAMR